MDVQVNRNPQVNERGPRKLSNAFNGTSDTLRGEFAHFSYESATQRFMTDKQVKCRRVLQLCLSGAFAMGLLSLVALYASQARIICTHKTQSNWRSYKTYPLFLWIKTSFVTSQQTLLIQRICTLLRAALRHSKGFNVRVEIMTYSLSACLH